MAAACCCQRDCRSPSIATNSLAATISIIVYCFGFIIKIMKLGGVALAFSLIVVTVTGQQDGAMQSGIVTICKNEKVGDGCAVVNQSFSTSGWSCGGCYKIQCTDKAEVCTGSSTVVRLTGSYMSDSNSNKNGSQSIPPDCILVSITDYQEMSYIAVPSFHAKLIRIPCDVMGGIEFRPIGHPNSTEVFITNVAGQGDPIDVYVKGSKTVWLRMSSHGCQLWEIDSNLVRQSLSFNLTASDNRYLTFYNVTPADWQNGKTYKSALQFLAMIPG